MEHKFILIHDNNDNHSIAILINNIVLVAGDSKSKKTRLLLQNEDSPIYINENPTKIKKLIEKHCTFIEVHGIKTNNTIIIPKLKIESLHEMHGKGTRIYVLSKNNNVNNNIIEVNETITKIVNLLNE